MILSHIIGNIFFWTFFIMNIGDIKDRIKKGNASKIVIISLLLGCVMYIIYLIMLILDFKNSGFDVQSFSMLILSWAFENSAYCIRNKKEQN